MPPDHSYILKVSDLTLEIDTESGPVPAVQGLSFYVSQGESLCLVGESGCGKTITALSVLGLLPNPPLRIASGEILFKGQNLVGMSRDKLRRIAGRYISMIFQEPMTALNPVFTIGSQIAETISTHLNLSGPEIKEKVLSLMDQVGIPEPGMRYSSYPHELSGGLRQRALIAMALACDPDLLIADEPTTALDVTIQAQIIALLKGLQRSRNLGLLFITHNLGVVAQIAQRVMIMYLGKIVEQADVRLLFSDPLHPYTRGLMASVPYSGTASTRRRLQPIAGSVPPIGTKLSGCPFYPRCPNVMDICRIENPLLSQVSSGHFVACHLYD